MGCYVFMAMDSRQCPTIMTETEINITIAEACGWTDITTNPNRGPKPFGLRPNERDLGYWQIPDYCHDLNAMHEAVKFECKKNPWFLVSFHDAIKKCANTELPLEATALQRAEAFLRVKGLWKE